MQTIVSRILTLMVPLVVYTGMMWYVFACEANWTARQTWAIVLAGVILIWYTWETMQLRFAAHAQRETQIRPYVMLKQEPGKLSVINVGNGVALHIHVDTVVVSDEFKIEVQFPKTIAVLRPGESESLEMRSFKQGKDAGDFFTAHLDPKYAVLDIDVKLRFDNVELKAYSTTQKFSPGKIVVSEVA